MNTKALAQVLEYIKQLAEHPPLCYDDGGHLVCWQCMAEFVDDADADDENQHDDRCPWRLMKEGLANLDNEGWG